MSQLIVKAFKHFRSSGTKQKGAAIAYYSVFSFVPILVLISSLFGLVFGEAAVNNLLYSDLESALGTNAAGQIQSLIKQQHVHHNSFFTAVVGLVVLIFGSLKVSNQLKLALHQVLGLETAPKALGSGLLVKRMVTLLVLSALFFFITSSLLVHALLTHIDTTFNNKILIIFLEHLLSFMVMCVFFSLVFKYMSNFVLSWPLVLLGGLASSIFFLIGKIGVAYYITHTTVVSVFGVASSLVLIMLWMYYMAQVFFIGASVIKVKMDKSNDVRLQN